MNNHKNKIIIILSCCLSIFAVYDAHASELNKEELLRSICTFYEGITNHAGPAGLIISETVNGKREYYALTASHVIGQFEKISPGKRLGIGFAAKLEVGKNTLLHAPFNQIPHFRFQPNEHKQCDLGAIELTSAIEYSTNNGARATSIDLDSFKNGLIEYNGTDSNVVRGIGIACRRDFQRFGIGIGSDMFCLCSDIHRPIKTINNKFITNSLIYFNGKLKLINAPVTVNKGGNASVIILEGYQSANGNSGSPVFAWGEVNGKRHPFLVGVVQGLIPGKNETSVMPIDGLPLLMTKIHKVSQ